MASSMVDWSNFFYNSTTYLIAYRAEDENHYQTERDWNREREISD